MPLKRISMDDCVIRFLIEEWAMSDVAVSLERLRAGFNSGVTRELSWRESQLDALLALLEEAEGDLIEAMREDLGRPAAEAYGADIATSRSELALARDQLRAWAQPRPVAVPKELGPASAQIVPEPLGVVLVISPWNYPVQLLLQPLGAALAAGNCVAVKPSELSPATSALLAKEIRNRLDPSAVAVVEGDAAVAEELLQHKFDHIMFTGSSDVGRVVMEAAAKHLTPVTLELGGKCPTYVHGSADVAEAARRIGFGKFMNAGQTCLAPDYILVDHNRLDSLVEALGSTIEAFYGDDPIASPDFGRIVSERHARRLVALRDEPGAGTVVAGGGDDVRGRYVAPTVLVGSSLDAAIMQQEIFGPLLPVIGIDGLDEAIEFAAKRPKPLAAYIFATDDDAIERWIAEVHCGGMTINAPLLHNMPPELPFGGVGLSGTGAYHGQHGFDRFSHLKSVLRKPLDDDLRPLMPPYPS
jgi:aldehyde dehydrogenase (NAD+)